MKIIQALVVLGAVAVCLGVWLVPKPASKPPPPVEVPTASGTVSSEPAKTVSPAPLPRKRFVIKKKPVVKVKLKRPVRVAPIQAPQPLQIQPQWGLAPF
jgi:hypothetical protein